MAKKSLLKQAQETVALHKGAHIYSEEELELVEAWLNGNIQLSKMAKVLNIRNTSQVYVWIAMGCRQIFSSNGKGK